MRKVFVAGNWKMNLSLDEARALAEALRDAAGQRDNIEVGIFPPFVFIADVAQIVRGTRISVGAQNMHFERSGAFTGEVSGPMLKEVGCKYAIIGHSERRHIFGESDSLINRKIKAALRDGLLPLFCIGERLEEREAGKTSEVLRRQVVEGLRDIPAESARSLVIAYEPVWAIGTGKTATPEQAEEAQAFVRELLADAYSREVAEEIRIQYGGSVKPGNAYEIMKQPDVDGALVGGASLKADSFLGIVEEAARAIKESAPGG